MPGNLNGRKDQFRKFSETINDKKLVRTVLEKAVFDDLPPKTAKSGSVFLSVYRTTLFVVIDLFPIIIFTGLTDDIDIAFLYKSDTMVKGNLIVFSFSFNNLIGLWLIV